MIAVFLTIVLTACDDAHISDDIFNGVFVLSDSKSGAESPSEWIAVIGDKITLKQGNEMYVFTVKKDGDIYYSADCSDKNISLTFTGEKLSVKFGQDQREYVLDKEYKYSQTTQPLSIPVSEPQIITESGVHYVGFPDVSGGVDLKVQIKKAGEESYFDYAIERTDVKIAVTDMESGDNFVKIFNVGGYPNIDDSKNLFVQSDSEGIEYKITVDSGGKISYVQNEVALEDGVYQFAYADGFLTQEEQERCNFIVIDNVLRRDYKGGNSLYYLSEQDEIYSAHLGSEGGAVGITLTVNNGVISAKISNSDREYQLKKNYDYTYLDETQKLDVPTDFEGEIADGGKYVFFSIGAGEYSFPIGARVEIKKSGESSYCYDSIAKRYMDRIQTDNLFAQEFKVGENYIRICNAGGPDYNNKNNYYTLSDSDYIEYKIILDEKGVLSNLVRLS